ncbi:hypothetical protein JR316_0004662 [Psilocybe cubensis]|uniref:Uncharacterized protein n=1 Tax=Psilocybe cubensis TaxID=181762 RepID=A0ACB8H4J0_PSICU|nr:hypothetical protein JR316_0004662 [Psilocybe cubensis]KAH9482562.1 hypothetical protein JR316_0004662 [Psilocybe cubensis]
MSYSSSAMSYSFIHTASSTPSFNLFIPSSASASREMHETYTEFGLVLRPSNKQRQTTSSNGSIKSSKSSVSSPSTRSKPSSLKKWFGDHISSALLAVKTPKISSTSCDAKLGNSLQLRMPTKGEQKKRHHSL